MGGLGVVWLRLGSGSCRTTISVRIFTSCDLTNVRYRHIAVDAGDLPPVLVATGVPSASPRSRREISDVDERRRRASGRAQPLARRPRSRPEYRRSPQARRGAWRIPAAKSTPRGRPPSVHNKSCLAADSMLVSPRPQNRRARSSARIAATMRCRPSRARSLAGSHRTVSPRERSLADQRALPVCASNRATYGFFWSGLPDFDSVHPGGRTRHEARAPYVCDVSSRLLRGRAAARSSRAASSDFAERLS
jgi:hypothetical protein